jgi:hypothetical protein
LARTAHRAWVSNDFDERPIEPDDRHLPFLFQRVLDGLLERHRLPAGPGSGERLLVGSKPKCLAICPKDVAPTLGATPQSCPYSSYRMGTFTPVLADSSAASQMTAFR